MKKVQAVLCFVLLLALMAFTLASCRNNGNNSDGSNDGGVQGGNNNGGNEDGSSDPTKLSTPTVTVSESGVASWQAVANATGYIYKINGGTETSTLSTSVQLTDGESIAVKAVGDGTNYTDSDDRETAT
jgi:hypothetical protein